MLLKINQNKIALLQSFINENSSLQKWKSVWQLFTTVEVTGDKNLYKLMKKGDEKATD